MDDDMYHPLAYIDPEDGGSEAEYEPSVDHVALRDVAVERRIRVEGPDAEAFVDQDSRRGRYAGVSVASPKIRPDEPDGSNVPPPTRPIANGHIRKPPISPNDD
jgi:hypothetical protein